MAECVWDCPPAGHRSHCFLSDVRQARMSDAYRRRYETALSRPCPVTSCSAGINQLCQSSVVVRATGQRFGWLRESHLERVLA